ncbi:MAG TPA: DUF4131 domain-containing protein, partial [Terriglobia bacterium]|nr:DUF4131 domain-containing protein [Terriglobia bacterium]
MASTLLLLASCFAAGIALGWPGRVGPVTPPPAAVMASIPMLLASGAACLLVGLLALRTDRERIALVMALGGFVLAGAASGRLFEFRFPPNHIGHLEPSDLDPGRTVRIEGRLVSGLQPTPYGSQFDLAATALETAGGPGAPARALVVSGKVRLRLDRPTDPGGLAAEDAL